MSSIRQGYFLSNQEQKRCILSVLLKTKTHVMSSLCLSCLNWLLSAFGHTLIEQRPQELQGLLDDPIHRASSVFEHQVLYLLPTEEPNVYLDIKKDQKVRICVLEKRQVEDSFLNSQS
jgi:hypothetical protein